MKFFQSLKSGISNVWNRAKSMVHHFVAPPTVPSSAIHTTSAGATPYSAPIGSARSTTPFSVPKRNVVSNRPSPSYIDNWIKQHYSRPKPTTSPLAGGTSSTPKIVQVLHQLNSSRPSPSQPRTSSYNPSPTSSRVDKYVNWYKQHPNAGGYPAYQKSLQNKRTTSTIPGIQGTTPSRGGTTTPPSLQKGNERDVVDYYVNKYLKPIDYNSLANQAKTIAEQTYQPIETQLKKIITNIKSSYQSAQNDLLENQKKEAEQLKGAYAVRGLLNSGAYTQALQDLQKKHVQELNDLTQKEQNDITNISYSVASKKPTAINNILNLMTRELQGQRTRASVLLGSLLTNSLTNERENKKAKQANFSKVVTDENGNQYIEFFDANGNLLNKVYAGKSNTSNLLVHDTSTGKSYDIGTPEGIKQLISTHPEYRNWDRLKDYLTTNSKMSQNKIDALMRQAGISPYSLTDWQEAAKEALKADKNITTDEFISTIKSKLGNLTDRDIFLAKGVFNAMKKYEY